MTVLNESPISISSALAREEIAGLVSIVITSYNKGPYLAEAIDSALGQDYPHQEILVIDDGSTDHTPEVAGAYQDRIRYIRQENRGPSSARTGASSKHAASLSLSWMATTAGGRES